MEYGGTSGKWSYFADGSHDHNGIGIENPTPSSTPIHDFTDQWKSFLDASYIINDSSRISAMGGASYTQYEVPNTPGLPAGTDANGVTWASAMPASLIPSGTFDSSDAE